MKVLTPEGTVESDGAFVDAVSRESGQDVRSCYQCGKCTAGCPTAFAMDLAPSQIMRATQAGLKDLVLASSAIWLCAGCETCASRCPRDLDPARVNKALTAICLREGRKPKERGIAAFHKSFIDSVSHWGRAHEFELIGLHKARTLQFTKDMPLGLKLFQRGRLALKPERIKGVRKLRKMLRKRHPQAKGPYVHDLVDIAETLVDVAEDTFDHVVSHDGGHAR